MLKIRKNFVTAPCEDSNSNELIEDEDYDSMIENGTSDESDDEDDDENVSSGSVDATVNTDEESNASSNHDKKSIKKLKRQNDDISPTADMNLIKKLKPNKIADKKNKHLYKQPTVEEINQLKETENLFHSNLFRMQITEMLQEVKIKDKYLTFMNKWLNEFNTFLNNLNSMKNRENFNQQNWLKKSDLKVPIALDHLNSSSNFQFQFLKPNDPAIMIGSALSQTILGPQLICDLCITMPQQTFLKNDYLNLIYDQKRAIYLTYLAWQLNIQQFQYTNIQFNYFNNNPYKAVLEITPCSKWAKKLKFRIFVVPENTNFKLNRFVPTNSNIRSSLFNENSAKNDEISEVSMYPTSNYNCSVLSDLTMINNSKLIEEIINKNKNIQDGLILLKIWLTQKQLNIGYSGFGNYIMTCFVLALYKQRKLHATMSSYQVARNVWNHLAISEWHMNGKGFSMCCTELSSNQPTLDEMHSHHDVVFIDPSGFNNICANLSLDIYLRIKFEAARAIELLNNYKINSFHQLFMIKYPIYIQFDHLFGIVNQDVIDALIKKETELKNLYNYAGYWFPHALQTITKILRKGLGERILSLTPIESSIQTWDCSNKPNQITKTIKFGVILNPENAYEVVDKGPQANDKSVVEFRNFWGQKSELRRFKDGSITEACLWSSTNARLTEKRLIVKKIIEHLMLHHFNDSKLKYIANNFDIVYQLNSRLHQFKKTTFDAENTSVKVIKCFDEIAKKLRSLNELALDIVGVLGTSPVFRYCYPEPILNEAFGYIKNNQNFYRAYAICHGTIQLGISGKWPNDLTAFRHIKAAFHIQIASALRNKYKLKTRGSIEGVYILDDGYLFCLEISHPKEIALLKKKINDKKLIQYNDTPESIELEKRLNILPKLNSALHGLYQRYPSFGPSVMIAKRWLNAQLIDSYLWPDECTELLIASQYLKMNSLPNPCQPQTGFLRFLHMLVTTDWSTEYVLLNFNDTITDEEKVELDNRLTTERNTFPKIFIATSYDQNKYGIWCQQAPNEQIIARVTLLAQYAINIIEPVILLNKSINFLDLFTASLDGYDIVIKLKDDVVPICRAYEFESKNKKITQKIPFAGLNPIEKALHELREGYSEYAVFFYNQFGGKYITVIWKPNISEVKPFKLTAVNGCKLLDNNREQLQCNKAAIIEDFKIILNNLYISCQVKT